MFHLYISQKMTAWFSIRESGQEVSFQETIPHHTNCNPGKAKRSQLSKKQVFELPQAVSPSSEAPLSSRLHHPTCITLHLWREVRADRAFLRIHPLLSSLSRRLSPKFPLRVSSRWTWSGRATRQLLAVVIHASHLKIMAKEIWPWILKSPRGIMGHPCPKGSDSTWLMYIKNTEWDK